MFYDMQENLTLFAKLSGDYNPVHLDSHFAKNSYFGTQIIYGIYQVFHTLESVLKKCPSTPLILSDIKATFHAPISKDLAPQMKVKGSFLTQSNGGGAKHNLQPNAHASQNQTSHLHWNGGVFLKGECMSSISLTLKQAQSVQSQLDQKSKQDAKPNEQTESLAFDSELLQRLFPLCAHLLDRQSIGTLLASTRIVGMQTPGLHSIYSSLCLTHTLTPESQALRYTHKTHSLLQLTTLNFIEPMQGSIKAFTRPQRISNQTFQALLTTHAKDLESQPFKGQRALVIGAGSGLGNTCAKLLALGGAEVLATTHTASFDQSHPKIHTTHFDVLKINAKALHALDSFHPTHLYYFATPSITANPSKALDKKKLVAFLEHYVLAPSSLVQALTDLKAIFQPSSVFVEELPLDFCEYTLAKATLESYGSFLHKKGFHTALPRLPKVATNQTLSLIPQNLQSTSEALIGELLSFAKLSSEEQQ